MSVETAGLRTLVREVLRELLPAAGLDPAPRPVPIADDDQLNAFVRELLTLADDPVSGALLRSGRMRFTLAGRAAAAPRSPGVPAQPAAAGVVEVDDGVLSERIVRQAVTDGASLVVGAAVAITPLAREAIRRSGIELVRRP
ncbi:hypothetical protein [Gordonia sp. FQ]|uniref:hypothetical protein n=1 Tax=Gordonia sp. FQ TaxID=3446634 RepID=UPI003F855519